MCDFIYASSCELNEMKKKTLLCYAIERRKKNLSAKKIYKNSD